MNRRRPPSGLFVVALLAALALAGFAVDRWVPPQHLPWKPLSLDQPIGLATHGKIARLDDDVAACRAVLAAGGVRFHPATAIAGPGYCATAGVGRLTAGLPPLRPPGPVMTCREALALAIWTRRSLEPAAREAFHAEVAGLDHFGTYACRAVRGGGRGASQHATANAIDVAAVRLADGRRITVLADYRRGGPRAAFLRRVEADACRVFSVVLGPDYNAAHRDHLHLDMGPWRVCR